MKQTKIFGKTLTKEELAALLALAADAGCDVEKIEIVDSVGEPEPDCEDEVILILASAQTCAEPTLEKELAKVPNGGRRAVWIWPKDAETTEVPEASKKYSYSIVAWNAQKLSVVLADDDVTCFELPTGQPLPKVEMERNLCVEGTKKTK